MRSKKQYLQLSEQGMAYLTKTFSIIGKLIPFIVAITLYFTQAIPSVHKIVEAYVKCLPIICLILFAGLYAMNINDEAKWYIKVIMLGLAFCGIGDILLVWPSLSVLGIVAFAIGHICYIFAFGFEPRAWISGIIVFLCITGILAYVVQIIESTVELIFVIIYGYIIFALVWRACGRVTVRQNRSWSKLLTAIGTITFATSDLILILNKYELDLHHHREVIMSTYYAAQLLITLSILEPRFPSKHVSIYHFKIIY